MVSAWKSGRRSVPAQTLAPFDSLAVLIYTIEEGGQAGVSREPLRAHARGGPVSYVVLL